LNQAKTLAVTCAALAALIVNAHAADISGAGATFSYPIYAKWAAAYKKETGVSLNYQSIGCMYLELRRSCPPAF
jgi:phosphate transport system substrate-binding protein